MPIYRVLIDAEIESTLDEDELQRQLVIALWEGMDESLVIPDGASKSLQVIEYIETLVEEMYEQ